MLQRTTQVLKLFAILIFSFELLTPLFLSGDSAIYKNQGTQFVNTATSQNQPLCLVAEEIDSSEESGEGHKEFTAQFDFDLTSVLYLRKRDYLFVSCLRSNILTNPSRPSPGYSC